MGAPCCVWCNNCMCQLSPRQPHDGLADGAFILQSGALLACGIVNSGVRNECDPALALLSDYVLHNSNTMRIGAIFG